MRTLEKGGGCRNWLVDRYWCCWAIGLCLFTTVWLSAYYTHSPSECSFLCSMKGSSWHHRQISQIPPDIVWVNQICLCVIMATDITEPTSQLSCVCRQGCIHRVLGVVIKSSNHSPESCHNNQKCISWPSHPCSGIVRPTCQADCLSHSLRGHLGLTDTLSGPREVKAASSLSICSMSTSPKYSGYWAIASLLQSELNWGELSGECHHLLNIWQ